MHAHSSNYSAHHTQTHSHSKYVYSLIWRQRYTHSHSHTHRGTRGRGRRRKRATCIYIHLHTLLNILGSSKGIYCTGERNQMKWNELSHPTKEQKEEENNTNDKDDSDQRKELKNLLDRKTHAHTHSLTHKRTHRDTIHIDFNWISLCSGWNFVNEQNFSFICYFGQSFEIFAPLNHSKHSHTSILTCSHTHMYTHWMYSTFLSTSLSSAHVNQTNNRRREAEKKLTGNFFFIRRRRC